MPAATSGCSEGRTRTCDPRRMLYHLSFLCVRSLRRIELFETIDAPSNRIEPPTANEQNQLNTERLETAAQSTPALKPGCSRCPKISFESAEVGGAKSGSISVAYEFRTKSAQSGGSETNGPRERNSGLGGCVAVRRFVREARGYWASMRARSRQRMLVAEGLAVQEGFELPVWHDVRDGQRQCIST